MTHEHSNAGRSARHHSSTRRTPERSARSARPRISIFWLASLIGGSLFGCALIDGLIDSDGDKQDGGSNCTFDPQAADCLRFTCDSPFQLGKAAPDLSALVDTCGAASNSDFAVCSGDGRAADIIFSFDLPDAVPYTVCIRGGSGGVFMPLQDCGVASNPADAGPPLCMSDDVCMDLVPTRNGPQFLMWESLGPGACGQTIIDVFTSNMPPSDTMPDSGPVDGPIDSPGDGGTVDSITPIDSTPIDTAPIDTSPVG